MCERCREAGNFCWFPARCFNTLYNHLAPCQDVVRNTDALIKARKVVEESIGEPVVSSQNYLENTKQKQQKRIEQQRQPSLFDEINEIEE